MKWMELDFNDSTSNTHHVLTFDEISVRVGDDSWNLIKAIAISEVAI